MITDVPGLRVGHWTDSVARTGCTVVLFPEGTVASGEVRGGAPATRETALLDPTKIVSRIDALVLTGGSAFGLAAADGAVRFCEERGMGVPTPAGPVPIVVALALYDLAVGNPTIRPTAPNGYAACEAATAPITADGGAPDAGAAGRESATAETARPADGEGLASATAGPAAADGTGLTTRGAGLGLAGAAVDGGGEAGAGGTGMTSGGGVLGLVGAGTGATVGGVAGGERRPGGLASMTATSGELVVSVLMAVNAFGTPGVADSDEPPGAARLLGNTTIGLVATNATLDKVGCYLVAQSAHDGLARAVFPAHTRFDGDAFVTAAVGRIPGDVDLVRSLATHVVAAAIRTLA